MEHYEIVVRYHIDKKRIEYFDGMEIIHMTDGSTLLSGNLADQAELHSILNRIRDLGLPLISVEKK